MMIYFEVEFSDEFSMACKGMRVPTIKEANATYESDVKKYAPVVSVHEIPFEEVRLFFDTSNIDNWPVFGANDNAE